MISRGATSRTGFRRRPWRADSAGRSDRAAGRALYALGGTVVGFAVFLIFYLLGGMGGGDVKLMAGFGALLGVRSVARSRAVDGGSRRNHGVVVLGVRAYGARWVRQPDCGQNQETRAGLDSLRSGDCAGRLVVAGAQGLRRGKKAER